MKLTDNTNGKLNQIKEFAEKIGLLDQLNSTLEGLEQYVTNKVEVTLFPDLAPYSLYFIVRIKEEFVDDEVLLRPRGSTILDGGIIYHGKHDGYGSGSAPTFSVTVDKADGWRIHT